MINWNNAPEWATHHGVAGTNRDPIWFNDTEYAYCKRPDNVFRFNKGGVAGKFNWQQSEIRDVTDRPVVRTKRIYYIAGPMSGLPNFNRDAFNAAAVKLAADGHTVLNPAVLPDGLSHAQYMDIDLAMLRCATHVLMLRGWDDSKGAFAERALAQKLGLTVEYL